jgi:hypothetical protein
MKTTEALSTLSALNGLGGRSLPIKFSYAAARNRRMLSEFAQVYEAKRMELLDQFAKKDEAGKLVTIKVTSKNDKGEDVEHDTGQAELADADGFEAAYKALNAEDVDIVLHQVKLDDCPPDMDIVLMDALIGGGMIADEKAAA